VKRKIVPSEEFRSVLTKLPEDQREALILVDASGFSYEDAAAICGCRVQTVKSRVRRARSRVTRLLAIERADLFASDQHRTPIHSTRLAAFGPEPPALAEFLVAMFVSAEHRDALLGDMEEKFNAELARGWSQPRARRVYWAEALRTIGPLAWRKVRGLGWIALLFGAMKKYFT
jgi:predicted DNA-binding protein (UPF0251 family)